MNFDFSDEQKQLKELARRFLSKESTPAKVRAVLESDAGYDKALWKGIADLGYCGAAIPEEHGGLGLGYLELCVIAEELGRALAPVPFSTSIFQFAEFVKAAGSDEQKAKYLPRLASGEIIGTLAHAETSGEPTPERIQSSVTGGKLTGTKIPVADGGIADVAVVVAHEAGKSSPVSLFLVDMKGEGVTSSTVKTVDPSRKYAKVEFRNAPAERLGAAGDGARVLADVMDRAAILTAFEQVGGSDAALEMACAYAKQRMAFGRPIGSFQAIKHMLADMYVSATLARSNAYYAAWALSTGAAELPVAAASARVAATQAFQHCSTNNIQVHGGMGFTWQFDCHLYYRRSNTLALSLGSQSHWETQLVDRMRQAQRGLRGNEAMNFDDTPEEALFRQEARAWIAANAPKDLLGPLERSGFATLNLEGKAEPMAAQKAWQKKKYDAGWACLHWPKEYGGRGATPIQRVIWQQEEGQYGKLSGVFGIGHGMCGPTVMAFASEDLKRSLLPRLASGEDIWCQLFSEPAGGSDLAGLRTKAEKRGDEWVINGQKIWTSGAQHSQWGLLLTRTDSKAVKHKGLTMFILRMDSPGVEVRPIRQMNEQSGFNEVYFTDVRIPDSQRLGAVNDGWKVSLTTLMNERLSIGSGMPTGFEELFEFCSQFETEGGVAIDDPRVKSRLAQWAVKASGLRYTALRSISALSKGETPGPENSIGKLVAGSMMQEVAKFALDLQAEAGLMLDADQAPMRARFQSMLMRSPATRIEGGSDEILRNIIAERVLGLPQDMRADKDLPFDKIPTSAG